MNIDNEKLFKALDNIAYVNRSDNFMMLPETQEEELAAAAQIPNPNGS